MKIYNVGLYKLEGDTHYKGKPVFNRNILVKRDILGVVEIGTGMFIPTINKKQIHKNGFYYYDENDISTDESERFIVFSDELNKSNVCRRDDVSLYLDTQLDGLYDTFNINLGDKKNECNGISKRKLFKQG